LATGNKIAKVSIYAETRNIDLRTGGFYCTALQ
jgi:hypothetical protein